MKRRTAQKGFTLAEVLVAIVFASIGIVGVLGGIRAIEATTVKGRTADLLQDLAAQKLDDLRVLQTPTDDGTSGDFSDRGYSDITWSVTADPTSVTNLDSVTVTVTRGKDSEALSTQMFIRPTTTAGTGSTGSSSSSTGAP